MQQANAQSAPPVENGLPKTFVAQLEGQRSPASDLSAGSQGNIAILAQLLRDSKVTELRTTYNGEYSANLLFFPSEITYYVALSQNGRLWRVVVSHYDERAEAVYTSFVRMTEQLAEVEIRRTRLKARKELLERTIALSEGRAKRLEADLDIARAQQSEVNDRQRQVRGEAAALDAEQQSADALLRELRSRVSALQRQVEEGTAAK